VWWLDTSVSENHAASIFTVEVINSEDGGSTKSNYYKVKIKKVVKHCDCKRL
jgi:hypothetical protein